MVGFGEIVGYRVGEGEIVGFGEPVGDDVVGAYVGVKVIDPVGSSDASSSLTLVLKVGELVAFKEVDGLDEAGGSVMWELTLLSNVFFSVMWVRVEGGPRYE